MNVLSFLIGPPSVAAELILLVVRDGVDRNSRGSFSASLRKKFVEVAVNRRSCPIW